MPGAPAGAGWGDAGCGDAGGTGTFVAGAGCAPQLGAAGDGCAAPAGAGACQPGGVVLAALRGGALTGSGGTLSPRMIGPCCASSGRTTLAMPVLIAVLGVGGRLDHEPGGKGDAVELA